MRQEPIERHNLGRGVVVQLFYDDDPESPREWSNVGEITYKRGSRYTLGSEEVDQDRFEEIVAGIKDGSILGLPVYAYVHSGSSIHAGENVFAAFDPGAGDSGLSGVVYCTKQQAISEFGAGKSKRLTKKAREQCLRCLRAEVEAFDQYLRGEVYGFVVEHDGEHVDSCWGFYGEIDYVRKEAREIGEAKVAELAGEEREELEAEAKEAIERRLWEERDVMTCD